MCKAKYYTPPSGRRRHHGQRNKRAGQHCARKRRESRRAHDDLALRVRMPRTREPPPPRRAGRRAHARSGAATAVTRDVDPVVIVVLILLVTVTVTVTVVVVVHSAAELRNSDSPPLRPGGYAGTLGTSERVSASQRVRVEDCERERERARALAAERTGDGQGVGLSTPGRLLGDEIKIEIVRSVVSVAVAVAQPLPLSFPLREAVPRESAGVESVLGWVWIDLPQAHDKDREGRTEGVLDVAFDRGEDGRGWGWGERTYGDEALTKKKGRAGRRTSS
ncbi:hypothetical protein DFH11DRAFT_1544083 [Phellopilus nigrolimitatus]|nr:hypothetical protein DFH11DRAFT_1544083 [Phellopilus nigrolimitatus]